MYRVTVEEQPCGADFDFVEGEYTHALIAKIEPPASLTQEAVQRYLTTDTLREVSEEELHNSDLADVVLVGSTQDATVIHAYRYEPSEEIRQLMGNACVGLLKVMGAEAEFAA